MFSGTVTNLVRPVSGRGHGGLWWYRRLERSVAARTWRTLRAWLKHLDLDTHGYCTLGNDSGKSEMVELSFQEQNPPPRSASKHSKGGSV